MTVKIYWTRCPSYQDAVDHRDCIYLHEWNGKAYYWGIIDRSIFGGSRRPINGKICNPRYGLSYRHWIEGCLRNGGSLYIGKVPNRGEVRLTQIEDQLIQDYPSELNTRKRSMMRDRRLRIIHKGSDRPQVIRTGRGDLALYSRTTSATRSEAA